MRIDIKNDPSGVTASNISQKLSVQTRSTKLEVSTAGVLDDIERLNDSNIMVENIVFTLKNISNDFNMHVELLANGYIDVIQKFIGIVFSTAKIEDGYDERVEGIQLTVMPLGTNKLVKAIMATILNFSMNVHIHNHCLDYGFVSLIT